MAVHEARGGRSASLNHDSLTVVPREANIRCLRDQIIVEPLSVVYSETIIVINDTKPVRGVVKAVGPGCYPKRYDHPDKHRRTKMWDSKVFRPTEVKVGDVVELGTSDGRPFSFQTFLWGNVLHLLAREEDVCGVVQPEALQ